MGQLQKLHEAEERMHQTEHTVESLNEQVSQLRLELLKEQEARMSEESFYAQTKAELSRSPIGFQSWRQKILGTNGLSMPSLITF